MNGEKNIMKPTKKETLKLICALIVTFIAIVLAIGIPQFTASWVNDVVTVFTALTAFWLWALNNTRLIFLAWSELKMACSRDTVAWEAVNKFDVAEEFSFPDACKDYFSSLTELDIDNAQIKTTIKKRNHWEFNIMQGKKIRHIRLEFKEKDTTNQINFKENASMSYKDSKKEYELFLELSDLLKKKIPICENNSDVFSINEYYCVSLAFSKLNPFFHLIVKHADNVNVEDFTLNMEVENLKIKVKEGQMTLISEKKEVIKNALKKYIAISEI